MLAIIIPYFKRSFFEETLESLANQTDKRFKVYIGDDASPESPKALLETFHRQFDFVYHRFETNLGGKSLAKQWERCIDLTKDETWCMLLGDDDYLDAHVVASWYQHYKLFAETSHVVRFASKLIEEDAPPLDKVYSHPVWELATDFIYRKHRNLTRGSLSEYIFNKTSYLKYGFCDYPLAWNSDDRAWLDFSENKPIYSINESIVSIRISNTSISGQRNNLFEKNLATLKFYEYIIKNKLKFYNKLQRHHWLDRYENTIKKQRPLKMSEWVLIIYCYLKYYDNYSLKKVIKRCVKAIIKYED